MQRRGTNLKKSLEFQKLKQYNEKFVTYELDPGNYTNEDLQKAVYPLGDQEGTLKIEYDELNKKAKLILTRFGLSFGT